MAYGEPGSILTIQTDFVEKGEQILRASRQTTRILSRQMLIAESRLAEYGKLILQENTPKGPDTWHHIGGLSGGGLFGSTDVTVGTAGQTFTEMGDVVGIGGVIEQFEIDFSQPSESPQGVQYAPFVILGHSTPSGGFVGGRPYPESAMLQMTEYINVVLADVARQVSLETVAYMSNYGADG